MFADLDLVFVTRLLLDGVDGFRRVRELGVGPSLFEGIGQAAWEVIVEHEKKYSKLPTIEKVGLGLGIKIESTPDVSTFTLEELVDDLEQRYMYKSLSKAVGAAGEDLKSFQIREAREHLQKALRDLDVSGVGARESVVDIGAIGEDLIARYNKIKNGERGIPTPWEGLDEVTLGWWAEDVVVLVAKMGLGKSWTAIQMAYSAWEAGKKVLFFTTEISQVALSMRFHALRSRLKFQDVRKARLGEFLEAKFFEDIRKFQQDRRLLLVGGQFNVDMNAVDVIVERERPDFVVVDGLYLIFDKEKSPDRSTRVGNNIEELARISRRRQIPILTTTQFNRKVNEEKEESVGVSKIGLSDVVGWAATYVLALIQTKKMRAQQQMKLAVLKAREDIRATITMAWDFENMNFAQLEIERETDEQVDDTKDNVEEEAGF